MVGRRVDTRHHGTATASSLPLLSPWAGRRKRTETRLPLDTPERAVGAKWPWRRLALSW
jgi:hypothetical protein